MHALRLLIVQRFQRHSWQHGFGPFALDARLPLTNDLMQTAICTRLFCG